MATKHDSLEAPFPIGEGSFIQVKFGPQTVAASKTNAIVERWVAPWPCIVKGVRYNAYSALSSGTMTLSASGSRIEAPGTSAGVYQTALTILSATALSAIAHSATAAFSPLRAEPLASAAGAIIGKGDALTLYVTTPASAQKTGFLAIAEIQPARA